MRLVLLGAPGAGKGTQAAMLSEKFNMPHISTGEIFRYHIKESTQLGIEANKYIGKGLLVPDEVTISIVEDRIKQKDCSQGFVLDGFPRTIPQAQQLDSILSEMGVSLDYVIDLHVPDHKIIERLSGRRTCGNCGASYHIKYNPTKVEGICDNCGSEVALREDDKEATLINRLKTYHEQTEPLIEYYKEKGKILIVHGSEKIKDTSDDVMKALGVS